MTAEGTHATLQSDMDQLSLNQALIDFEVANARVLDLTRRLMEAHGEISALRDERERLMAEYAELSRNHESMKSSQAFKMATKIWALRNAVGR